MPSSIATPRLLLRRARPGDGPAFHAILSDPAVMLYWSTPPHTDLAETQAWLAAMIASTPEESDDFVIERDGRLIGKVGAFRLPEFGYALARDQWGQGLAGEAVTAFVGHVFTRPDVNHLIADVDPRNAASLALLTRLGFCETGRAARTAKTHIGWCDSVYLRRDRADWLSRRD